MTAAEKYVVGTSGYSFPDWVGTFYPPGTSSRDMFKLYAQRFTAVELNFTFYRMPAARTMAAFVKNSPDRFEFWVKALQAITHDQDLSGVGQFVAGLRPLAASGKLAGVLLQFPQSFHRTPPAREFLAKAIDRLGPAPLAVEFRHASWATEPTYAGLRERNITLVVPDAPEVPGLFRCPPMATSRTGYLRLHSRTADKWAQGMAARYDYDYSADELNELIREWRAVEETTDKVYAFFNNCHRGQAAGNAESFRRLVGQL